MPSLRFAQQRDGNHRLNDVESDPDPCNCGRGHETRFEAEGECHEGRGGDSSASQRKPRTEQVAHQALALCAMECRVLPHGQRGHPGVGDGRDHGHDR